MSTSGVALAKKLDRDAVLVDAALAGDQDAYRDLYERHRKGVVNAVFRYCSVNDIDDMVQIVFVKVFSKMGQWKRDSKFGTWVYKVAVNEVLQEYRRSASKVIRYSESLDEPITDGFGGSAKWEIGIENKDIAIAGDGDKLRDAVAHLPRCWRDVTECLLREMTIDETAKSLGISEGAVKSYRSRRRRMVRRKRMVKRRRVVRRRRMVRRGRMVRRRRMVRRKRMVTR